MTQVELAMAMLMKTFDTYAGAEGSPGTLTRTETRNLLEKELPGLLTGAKNQEELEKLLKGLDFNGDAEVDFTEFMVMITALTCVCHNRQPKK